MIDVSAVGVQRQRNTSEETDYGYKQNINVDVKLKLFRFYLVTSASVHDSKAFNELLLPLREGRKVYANSAYRSAAVDAPFKETFFKNTICRKGHRNTPSTPQQESWNHLKAQNTHSRVYA